MTKSSGFTLIELLTTIAVMAIAVTLAVPGMARLIASSRLSKANADIQSALDLARVQASTTNEFAALCGSTPGGTSFGTVCTGQTGAVYGMKNGAVSTTALRSAPILPTGVTLTNVTDLRFAGDGLAYKTGDTAPYTGLIADLSSSALTQNAHACLYMTTGSVVNTCSSNTSCANAAPASCQ